MITVAKIVGESIDLRTGEEVPKSLVLTNGKQEISFPISDEVVMAIVRLMVEGSVVEQEEPNVQPEPVEVSTGLAPVVADLPRQKPASAPKAPRPAPEPVQEREPGELYNDALTGVGSL